MKSQIKNGIFGLGAWLKIGYIISVDCERMEAYDCLRMQTKEVYTIAFDTCSHKDILCASWVQFERQHQVEYLRVLTGTGQGDSVSFRLPSFPSHCVWNK